MGEKAVWLATRHKGLYEGCYFSWTGMSSSETLIVHSARTRTSIPVWFDGKVFHKNKFLKIINVFYLGLYRMSGKVQITTCIIQLVSSYLNIPCGHQLVPTFIFQYLDYFFFNFFYSIFDSTFIELIFYKINFIRINFKIKLFIFNNFFKNNFNKK